MERQYGPSNTSKKQKLMRKLFGTDSKNETNNINQYKTTTIQSKLRTETFDSSDCEHGEVLEITIDSENFVTPKKVTNTLAHENTFKSPDKQTHTHTVNRILSQAPQHVALLSPIQKTPTQNVRPGKTNILPISDQSLSPSLVQSRTSQNQIVSSNHSNIKNTHTHTQTSNETHAWSKKRFASAFSSRKRIPHKTHTNTYTNINNHLPNRNTPALASSIRTANNTQTHKRFKPYTLNRSSYNDNNSQTPIFRQHASNRHTVKQIQANSHTHTFAQNQSTQSSTLAHSRTHTFAQNQSTQSSTLGHIHSKQSHKQNISNTLVPILPKPTPAQTKTHLNATETLIITVPNKPITHNAERPANLGQLNKNLKPLASDTKIIQLNNKYVPKGVHLAIAIDKNKKLSKNAIKKITRNLASQL